MNKLLQYSGLIGSFLIMCGSLKFYIYYKSFNISVLRFFDFQEILTLFMDNILAYFGVLVFATIFIALLHNNVEAQLRTTTGSLEILAGQWKLIAAFLIFSLLMVLAYFFTTRGVMPMDLVYLILLSLVCFTLLPYLYILLTRYLSDLKDKKVVFEEGYFILFSTLLLFYTVITAYNEAWKVKHKNYYKDVTIVFKDLSRITSDDSTYFIGVSKNYVFVFSEITGTGTAYSIENVKSISFP